MRADNGKSTHLSWELSQIGIVGEISVIES